MIGLVTKRFSFLTEGPGGSQGQSLVRIAGLKGSVLMERKMNDTVPRTRRPGIIPGPDCVICTRERPSDIPALEILQVIESIAFCRESSCKKIWVDIISHHKGSRGGPPLRYRVIHPGRVLGHLCRFAGDPADPRQGLLDRLYVDRIRLDSETPRKVLFHRRLNCVGVGPKPEEVSLDGPGSCFRETDEPIELHSEVGGDKGHSIFSSYVVPPPAMSAIQPGEVSICRLELTMAPESYDVRIGNRERFAIESHARMMQDFETYELPSCKDDKIRRFYEVNVKAEGAIVVPKAYDIVIFQQLKGASAVCPTPNNYGIVPAHVPDPGLAGKLLWFFGREDFYLELGYIQRKGSRGKAARLIGSS